MKAIAWLPLLVLAAALVAGCGNSQDAAQDDAFQKQLAAAAAKNKGVPPVARKSRGAIPPEVLAKAKNPPKSDGGGSASP